MAAEAQVVSKPGVRKMAARLQEIIRNEDVMKNAFRNRERADLIQKNLERETNTIVVWQSLPNLADEQVRAGDPNGALATYDRFDELTARLGQTQSAKVRQMMEHERAVCYLRIGEQQN